MSAPGTCRCCSSEANLEQGICETCARTHGPRAASLLARCLAEPDFASVALARMPEVLRTRFAAALSAKCLEPKRGPGLRYTRAVANAKSRASA
jgi:hypothetical protein